MLPCIVSTITIDNQQDATILIHLFLISSTCFGRCFRPSSYIRLLLLLLLLVWRRTPQEVTEKIRTRFTSNAMFSPIILYTSSSSSSSCVEKNSIRSNRENQNTFTSNASVRMYCRLRENNYKYGRAREAKEIVADLNVIQHRIDGVYVRGNELGQNCNGLNCVANSE